jgi:hypothetical protein
MSKHKSFADIKAATYAGPKLRKKGGRTIAGAEPSHRADRPARASGGRTKPHAIEREHTIIVADPGIAGFAPGIAPRVGNSAAPASAATNLNHGILTKGEAQDIPSASGTAMKRGGPVDDRFSLFSIKRRFGQ